MPILNIQKRARELGRIRLGQKGDRGQPQKLDRFRFTSASQALLGKIADLYGGDVQPWTPAGGSPQFEVISNATRVPIMVPPQPVTQWHEAWRKSGCVHRCDGRTNVLTDEMCDPEDPLHQEALEKPTTRLNVVLRDVEGIGVWRVETHGWNAAIELPDVAAFLAAAGGYVNGWLSLEQRTSVDNSGSKPVTRHYLVPIIEIDVTPAQLMAGQGRVAPVSLAGPGETKAIEAPREERPAAAEVTIPTPEQIAGADLSTAQKMVAYLEANVGEHPATAAARERVAQLQPDADGVVDGEVVDDEQPAATAAPDADAVWQQIVTEAGRQGMTLPQVTEDFSARMGGLIAADATGEELGFYLGQLRENAQVAS